ncbi:DUF2179 domain-containing protein [Roseimarinus sediminis]|jgi:uncharacterized protein YebE (UPF0316 family)|uniref:DUF2179 domain-containing protein n=1 Tax=Roseimarinus sediminis TaxID=1610899 RepID=UPI003D1C346C
MENFDYFNLIVVPLLIFFARIIDVSIGTIRIVMVSKGNKIVAPFLGFVEVIIWIIAIGKIMQNLDNWVNIVAYAAGFATGNYLGLFIEEKMAMGVVKIQVITAKAATDLLAKLKAAGYGITHHEANGANGKVSILYSIVNRSDVALVIDLIRTYNPNAFYSIEDVKFVNRGVDSIYAIKRRRIRKGK